MTAASPGNPQIEVFRAPDGPVTPRVHRWGQTVEIALDDGEAASVGRALLRPGPFPTRRGDRSQ